MGLLSAQQPPVGAAMGQADMGMPADPEGQADKLSPASQQVFDLVIKQATDFILEDANIDALVASAEAKGPAQAIADMASEVIGGIYASATGASKNIPPEILSLAGSQVATTFASVLANEGAIDAKAIASVAEQAYDVGVKGHNGKAAPQPGEQMAPVPEVQPVPMQPQGM
jgi:hypothetical protein